MRRLLPLLLLAACAAPHETAAPARVSKVLGGDPAGYLEADAPRAFRFPADHGPHRGFRTEWWYATGNLRGADRRFGFELTLFRFQLSTAAPARTSAWAADEVYMAHFAVTDERGRVFRSFERFARGAAGLAGASPERVWVEDWSIEADGRRFPARLKASEDGFAIKLDLKAARPPVLNGDQGLSRKGPGGASYYYSMPRLEASGKLRTPEGAFKVEGTAWLDREWSTSALGKDQAGWDWFALHLADGRDLMYYRLRNRDGTPDPHSAGTLSAPDGTSRALGPNDVRLMPLARWTSPTGANYPVRWRLQVPAEGIDLRLEPYLEDQELRHAFRYWEGAVEASGSPGGEGYLEMTGYGGS